MTVDWINPAALFALAAVGAPILIHLFRRQRAAPLPFPSLRFVTPVRAPAIRPASLSDLRLLVLRVALVVAAAIAWAQPVIVTDTGRLVRGQTTARAVIIDDSPSVGDQTERMREAAAVERVGAAKSFEIREEDLRQGVRRAVKALDGSATARRELVVVSDFQVGALAARDLSDVPAEIGLRFVPVGDSSSPDPAAGGPARTLRDARMTLGAPGVSATAQTIELLGNRTRVVLAPSSRSVDGLRFHVVSDDRPQIDSLRRTVAMAGTPAVPDQRAIAFVFRGSEPPSAISAPRHPWMSRAIVRMRLDRRLQEASQEVRAAGRSDRTGWFAVANDPDGRPLVAVAAIGTELVTFVNARPADYLGAAAVRAALLAVAERPSWSEQETGRIPAATLRAWSRPASPVPASRWQHAPPGDARWCWGLVFVLLIAELFVRRRAHDGVAEEMTSRAA